MFTEIWQNIKKTPFLTLVFIVQVIITVFILLLTLTEYFKTEQTAKTALINWGNYEYMALYVPIDAQSDFKKAAVGRALAVSSLKIRLENDDMLLEDRYNSSIEIFKNLDLMTNEIKSIANLSLITKYINSSVTVDYRDDILSEDITKSDELDLYKIVKYYNSSLNTFSYNSLFISDNVFDFYDLRLSEGSFFKTSDYKYQGDYVPVIMGADYKKYYKIGEEFLVNIYSSGEYVNCKIIGFLQEDQYFVSAGDATILSYDNFVILPYPNLSIDEILNLKNGAYTYTFTRRILSDTSILCLPENCNEIYDRIEQIIEKYGFTDYIKLTKLKIQKQLASNYRDNLYISMCICVTVVAFMLLNFVFLATYRISISQRSQAIKMLVGQTTGGVVVSLIAEFLILFAVSAYFSTFLYNIYADSKNIMSFLQPEYRPKIYTSVLLVCLAVAVFSSILVSIIVNIRLRKFSISAMIRSNEIKREKSASMYKILLGFMFAVLSIYMLFITSYSVAMAKIDMYYTQYHSKNTIITNINKQATADAEEVKIDFASLGEGVLVNKYVDMFYPDDTPEDDFNNLTIIRGLYFKGNVPTIDTYIGEFFTEEEAASNAKIAVVGKNIYENYTETDNKGDIIFMYRDTKFKVVGVLGREDSVSNIDNTVFIPMLHALSFTTHEGQYTIDALDIKTVENAKNILTAQMQDKAMISFTPYSPSIAVSGPTDALMMMFVVVIINTIVYCVYFISRKRHILSVKKFIGYSKTMIFIDTFLSFLSLAAVSFVIGNVIMTALSQTVLSKIELFSLYQLDMITLTLSFIGTAAMAFIFTIIAINKTFHADTSELLRG